MRKHYIARKYQKTNAPFNDKAGNIRIDLCSDYEKILEKFMEPFVTKRKSNDDPAMDFFRLQRRLIEQKPRKIYKASTFKCPAGYEEKLHFLEMYIEKGANLIPFMTKSIRDLTREDLLLYDWGIYHFHISNQKEEKTSFMKRSDYLLLAYVEDSAVYFLDIVSHKGVGGDIWANQRYMDILRENWPELMEKFVLKECIPEQTFNNEELHSLRKSGVSTILKWGENAAIFSPGGGYASDMTSTQAVHARDYWMSQISDLERVWVECFGPNVLESIQSAPTCEDIEYVDIEMINCTSAGYLFIEKQTKLLFFVRKDDNRWIITTVSDKVNREGWDSVLK